MGTAIWTPTAMAMATATVTVGTMPMGTLMHRLDHPDQADHLEEYYADGEYLHDRWRSDILAFFNSAVPWLEDRGVHLREFEDGWVAVNPSLETSISDIAVPEGSARVIDHDELEDAETAPLVATFDLPAKRAVVLLREGRLIGNEDN
jgi:hypothetical protein